MKKLTNYLKIKNSVSIEYEKFRNKGFVSFVLSSTISRIVSFISVIFLARVLSKSDFGLLSYIDNIRNYVLIINGLGLSNVVLRYCAKSSEISRNKGYLYSSLIIGGLFDIVIIIISILFFYSLSFDYSDANQHLISLSLIPLFAYIFETFQIFFRSTFKNKLYSYISIFFSILMISTQLIFGYFWGISGIILARYLALFTIIAFSILSFKRTYRDKNPIIYPDKNELKSMIKLGISFLIAGASSTMISYNEVLIVSSNIKNELVIADFKAAGLVLQISYFFVNSIVLFVFPYFVKNHLNKKWIRKNYIKLTLGLLLLMIPLHVFLYLIMDYFIVIVFGDQYLSAIPLARLILITSLIQSVFRIPLGNILIAIGKEKVNVIINIVSLFVHYILTVTLVRSFSSVGAIFSTQIVFLISSLFMIFALYRYWKGDNTNEISSNIS